MKLSIDLLPQEFRIEELKKAKFYKTQTIGIVIILTISLIASVTVALRILQSQNIIKIESNIAESEKKVLGLKATQGSILLLKNRLGVINQYLEVSSVGVSMYKLINQLLPPAVSLNSISISRGGEIVVLISGNDAVALEQLFTNLLSKDTNQDKVKEVSMESFSRGRDGLYRLNFTVKPK